jgi:predicted RNA binding protein YcfA (HicA-like mRNA interferase family)
VVSIKLTNLSASQVIKALKRLGWSERTTSTGRNPHKIMKKDGNPALISIPMHLGKDVSPGLLRKDLKNAGIPLDKFLDALKGRKVKSKGE